MLENKYTTFLTLLLLVRGSPNTDPFSTSPIRKSDTLNGKEETSVATDEVERWWNWLIQVLWIYMAIYLKQPFCHPSVFAQHKVSDVTSYLHIAKGECQGVDSRVDLTKKILFVLFVHLLKIHPCQSQI